VPPSPGALLVRAHHPLLRPLAEHALYDATVEWDLTGAGRVLDLSLAPAGVLVLAAGQAVVEIAGRTTARGRPEGKFDFTGNAEIAAKLEPGVVRRRVGRGDWVVAGGHPPLHVVPDARIHCTTECEWFFVPHVDSVAELGVPGTDPLVASLSDLGRLEEADFLLRLTRFGALRHLTYDAVRMLSYFFQVRHYHSGEVVFAARSDPHPTLVLEGTLQRPGATFPSGSVLFEELLAPGGPPAVVSLPDDLVARGRAVTVELPMTAHTALLDLDDRLVARHDIRWEQQWNVVVGDPNEAAPDAQTIALNLAAREGRDEGPLSPAIPVLLIDADGPPMESRTGTTWLASMPLVGSFTTPPAPLAPWSDSRVGVVGLRPAAFTTEVEVLQLIKDVDTWLPNTDYRKVIIRIPRTGKQWAPVIARAISVDVITDDLMDPLPELVGDDVDVVRVARPRDGEGFRTATHTPFITLPRDPVPTAAFWRTGQPWSA